MANPAARQHSEESGLRSQLQGTLVLCRAVFITAVLGLGTAVLPDSLHMNKPENYPAAKLVALDPASKEHKSVDAMFDELEVVKPTLEPKKGLVIEGVPERVPLKPRRWWRSGLTPFSSSTCQTSSSTLCWDPKAEQVTTGAWNQTGSWP
jgi:hypothetical protein